MKKMTLKILSLINFISLLSLQSEACFYRGKNYENTMMKKSCSLCKISNRTINEVEYDKLMNEVINDIISEVLRNFVTIKQGDLDWSQWYHKMMDLTRARLESKTSLLDGYLSDDSKSTTAHDAAYEAIKFFYSKKFLEYAKKYLSRLQGIEKSKIHKFKKIIEIISRSTTEYDGGKSYCYTLSSKEYDGTSLKKNEIIEFIKILVDICKKKMRKICKKKNIKYIENLELIPETIIAADYVCRWLKYYPTFENIDLKKLIEKIYPDYEETLHIHYAWKSMHDDAERYGVRGVCRHRAEWLAYKISSKLGGQVATIGIVDDYESEKSQNKKNPNEANHECTLTEIKTTNGEKKWFVADPMRLTDLVLGVVAEYFMNYGKLPTIKECKKQMDNEANDFELGKTSKNGALGYLKCPLEDFSNSKKLFNGYIEIQCAKLTPNIKNYYHWEGTKKLEEYSSMIKVKGSIFKTFMNYVKSFFGK